MEKTGVISILQQTGKIQVTAKHTICQEQNQEQRTSQSHSPCTQSHVQKYLMKTVFLVILIKKSDSLWQELPNKGCNRWQGKANRPVPFLGAACKPVTSSGTGKTSCTTSVPSLSQRPTLSFPVSTWQQQQRNWAKDKCWVLQCCWCLKQVSLASLHAFSFLKSTSCTRGSAHWLLSIICPNHLPAFYWLYALVLKRTWWTMIEGAGKLLFCELKWIWISYFQHFSIFASLTFSQCSCEPCLEMPFAQTLHSKYRLSFLNHLPQTSCPQAALFVVFYKEVSVIPKAWLQLRPPFVDFSQTFPVVLRAERRSPDVKAEYPSVPFKFQ